MRDFWKEAANVKPSRIQLDWYAHRAYAFIHFGINTFTGREWGTGEEDESLFAPRALDCRQWARVIRDAGLSGMILVAKHHDGFCLWDTAYTDHSVMHSPFGRDVVKEAAEACREYGLFFGFYLSPWDRNQKTYGTDAYNDFFCGQLEELLTNYGPISMVWFDNACGEGPDGRRQVYDFPRYIELIRRLQPDAAIFNDYGPDVRWCGNEEGRGRESEWAVVPSELCRYSAVQTGPGPLAGMGSLSYLYNTEERIGTLETACYSRGLVFAPAEVDVSIRPGWFWHEDEEPKSVERLFAIWLSSVGNNACLNLNLPPNRDGLIDPKDVSRLMEFRERLDAVLGEPLPLSWERSAAYPMQPAFLAVLTGGLEGDAFLELREKIEEGQRIESFRIVLEEAGAKTVLFSGTTVGNRRICPLKGIRAAKGAVLRVEVLAARDEVLMEEIRLYAGKWNENRRETT